MAKAKINFVRELNTKAAIKRGDLESLMVSVPSRVARPLALWIKRRVARLGQPAQPAHTYTSKGPRLISPRYDVAGKEGPSGAKVFESSKAFHRAAGAKRGTYDVSGGMWDGLTVMRRGTRGTSIVFRFRSEGQGMQLGSNRSEPHFRFMKGAGRTLARPKKVSNALKAKTLLRSIGRNVLLMEQAELEAMAAAITFKHTDQIKEIAGQPVIWKSSGKKDRLTRLFLQALT